MSQNEGTLRSRYNIGLPSDTSKPDDIPAIPLPGNKRRNFYFNQIPALSTKENSSKKKYAKKKRTLRIQLEKYCENTTLHGLRYVGDTHLTYGERIFWFVSFSLAIGVASYYISNIYTKWNSSPVIISFSPYDTDLGSIPFPAVTICNMNQAKKSEALQILKDGSILEKKLLDESCHGNATYNNSETLDWKSLRNFLIRVGNSCSDMLRNCHWGNEKIDCADIFNNDLTDEGLCCSFNRLPPETIFRHLKRVKLLNQTYPNTIFDWDAETGFEGAAGDFIPRKPLGAGAHMGLSVTLNTAVDNYYCSSTYSTGFKVLLSEPIQTPKMADYGILISPGFESRIAIEPAVLEATASLRKIPVKKRQCYFADERPLHHYRKYSSNNCKFECQSVKILENCGCVPYHLPKDESTNVCPRNDECSQRTLDLIAESDRRKSNSSSEESIECPCLPRCFKIDFFYFMTSAPLKSFRKSKYSQTFMRDNFAKVLVFFDSTSYSSILKMPLYTFTDLLAYTGGLLGLFIGFSFLSVIEIFFHIIWITWKKYIMTLIYKKNTVVAHEDDFPPPYAFVN